MPQLIAAIQRIAMSLIATGFAMLAMTALLILGDHEVRSVVLVAAFLASAGQYRLQGGTPAAEIQATWLMLGSFGLGLVAIIYFAAN